MLYIILFTVALKPVLISRVWRKYWKEIIVPLTYPCFLQAKLCPVRHYANPREGGDIWLLVHWSPSFINTFSYSLAFNFRYFNYILIFWFKKLIVQTLLPLILIYRKSISIYHHCRCTSIYQPLSYPFRSLALSATTQTR